MAQAFRDSALSPVALRQVWDKRNRRGENPAKTLSRHGELGNPILTKIVSNYSTAAKIRKRTSELPPSTSLLGVNQRERLEGALEKALGERENLIDNYLAVASAHIDSPAFQLAFDLDFETGDKHFYRLTSPFGFNTMASLAVSNHIERAYGLRSASREQIVTQLRHSMADDVEKTLVRGDIEKFFDSIDHGRLKAMLRRDGLIGGASLRIVERFLKVFELKQSGRKVGVPRGIGLSTVLAEVYLSDFDREMSLHPRLIYYARYVDDFVALFSPTTEEQGFEWLDWIGNLLSENKLRLTSNQSKLSEQRLGPSQVLTRFDFLGYSFSQPRAKSDLYIGISARRLQVAKRRLDATFGAYSRSTSNTGKSSELLYWRLRYLTSNTRLQHNKRAAYAGVKFSNPQLTSDLSDLHDLDDALQALLKSTKLYSTQTKRLKRLSFVRGFENTIYINLSYARFSEIVSAWGRDG